MLRSLIQETRQSAAKQCKARGYDWILVDSIGQPSETTVEKPTICISSTSLVQQIIA